MNRRCVAAFAVLLSGCCIGARSPHLLTPDLPTAAAIGALAPPLAANENILPTDLRHGENSSIELVQVRDREEPHIHTRYDLTITLVRGSGTLWLNNTPLPMHVGDVAFIPKGTPHYFVNGGWAPAASLVVFAPPFSGPDRQPLP